MPRQYQTAEVNTFSRGLITEASPLTFPEGASISEDNFELNKDGTRRRRLGMAEGTGVINSPSLFTNKRALVNVFEWNSPGGFTERSFLAVQDGTFVRVFDRTSASIGTAQLVEINLQVLPTARVSFASVDGILVVASGNPSLTRVEFDGTNFTTSSYRLEIRDVFGVEDQLTSSADFTTRPDNLLPEHTYNLRNQSWAVPRKLGNSESAGDCISNFSSVSGGKYPSNADTVNQSLYADVQDEQDRVGRRFFASDVINNPLGTIEAARGYFIIDALSRGITRRQRIDDLYSANTNLNHPVSGLLDDITAGGASVVHEYGGRVFYAGFQGDVTNGDSRSPRLSSYVLFSRLIQDPTDVNRCYTDADPTNPDDFEQVATDGGFIRIDGVNNIVAMAVLRESLYVLAENGVWAISGGGSGFSSTDIVVNRVTEKGALTGSSVIVTDQSLLYWSDSGIYTIGPNEFGDYLPSNLSNTTIQELYDLIPYETKRNAVGVFDSYERKVRWIYGGNRELILDTNLNAFYTNTFNNTKDVRASFLVPPFRTVEVTENVTVNGELVTANGAAVTITFEDRQSAIREVSYLVATERGGETGMTFATLSDTNFQDWGSFDAPAHLITGYAPGGDFQRYKDVPYLTLHFMKTETGFDEDFNLVGQSSCMVRSAWEWANSANSNRWSRQFQGYRHKRQYIPENDSDTFDNGFETVITKNKLRGKGKVLSLHFNTEPMRDCHILGWSYVGGIAGNV